MFDNAKGWCIFLDIDGTVLKSHGSHSAQIIQPPEILPGVRQFFDNANSRGDTIVITTGREESCRDITVKQLNAYGLGYKDLLMGLGNKPRHLINDRKLHSPFPTATCDSVDRNVGLMPYNDETGYNCNYLQKRQYILDLIWDTFGYNGCWEMIKKQAETQIGKY